MMSSNLACAPAMDFSRPLWLVRDEADVAAIGRNAAALQGPLGPAIAASRDYMARFTSVLICMNDAGKWPGCDMVRAALLDTPVQIIRPDALAHHDSVAALIGNFGLDVLKSIPDGAAQLPYYGLTDLGDVPYEDYGAPMALYLNSALDDTLGGMRPGELSIWTGKRGQGKSTFLNQLMLNCIQQVDENGNQIKACIYSGELKVGRLARWIYQQAAGAGRSTQCFVPGTNRDYWSVRAEFRVPIANWLRGRLFAYDNSIADASNIDSILRVFSRAANDGCRVFLWDNIMSSKFRNTSDQDYYRQQSEIILAASEWTKQHDCHLHMIAHPRKDQGDLTIESIAGSGDIANAADIVCGIKKLDDAERAANGFDSLLSIMKNREFGDAGDFSLYFDKPSRRFYRDPGRADIFPYAWEEPADPLPF